MSHLSELIRHSLGVLRLHGLALPGETPERVARNLGSSSQIEAALRATTADPSQIPEVVEAAAQLRLAFSVLQEWESSLATPEPVAIRLFRLVEVKVENRPLSVEEAQWESDLALHLALVLEKGGFGETREEEWNVPYQHGIDMATVLALHFWERGEEEPALLALELAHDLHQRWNFSSNYTTYHQLRGDSRFYLRLAELIPPSPFIRNDLGSLRPLWAFHYPETAHRLQSLEALESRPLILLTELLDRIWLRYEQRGDWLKVHSGASLSSEQGPVVAFYKMAIRVLSRLQPLRPEDMALWDDEARVTASLRALPLGFLETPIDWIPLREGGIQQLAESLLREIFTEGDIVIADPDSGVHFQADQLLASPLALLFLVSPPSREEALVQMERFLLDRPKGEIGIPFLDVDGRYLFRYVSSAWLENRSRDCFEEGEWSSGFLFARTPFMLLQDVIHILDCPHCRHSMERLVYQHTRKPVHEKESEPRFATRYQVGPWGVDFGDESDLSFYYFVGDELGPAIAPEDLFPAIEEIMERINEERFHALLASRAAVRFYNATSGEDPPLIRSYERNNLRDLFVFNDPPLPPPTILKPVPSVSRPTLRLVEPEERDHDEDDGQARTNSAARKTHASHRNRHIAPAHQSHRNPQSQHRPALALVPPLATIAQTTSALLTEAILI